MKTIYQVVLIIAALVAVYALGAWRWLRSLFTPERAYAIPSTSTIASAIAVEGFVLQAGNGASPLGWITMANIQDWNEPNMSEKVDVTNVGDNFRRRIPTLLDMGPVTFKVFWVMTEPTHQNAYSVAIGSGGFRYMWRQQLLVNWQAVYPNTNQSVDQFAAYVTSFKITGKVGHVFEAEIELSPNTGSPVLA